MAFSFEGKRVLITGAVGGLGLAIVQKFYETGASVYALDYNQQLLDNLKKTFPKVRTICTDLGNWDETKNVIPQLGPLDHLVNNAGIGGATELIPQVSHQNLERTMNINFKAHFNVSQEFSKNVIANSIKGATIVNVSSALSTISVSGMSAYSCSKAALSMLTKCLAVELGVYDIRVNAILPTVMATGLFADLSEEVKKSGGLHLQRAPYKEVLSTSDAANLVLYLSSPMSKMITGTNFPIDGGLLAT